MDGDWLLMGKCCLEVMALLHYTGCRTMIVTDKHMVRYNGREVRYLNELEYINNEVWANVWQSGCIARISPKDGSLLGWILRPSLSQGLLKSGHKGIDVLNGIAWDSGKQRKVAVNS